MSLLPAATRVLLVTILFAACSGGSELFLPGDGEPARIVVFSGNEQTGRVGEPLSDSLVFEVTDSQRRPLEGVRIAFELTAAGPGADVLPDTAETNADGRAYTRVVLGTTIGTHVGQAWVVVPEEAQAPSTEFQVIALPENANEIVALSGENQSGPAGSALPQPLVVQVRDAFGNPISGVAITWTAEGGGSLSQPSSLTNSEGQASVQRTLGPTAGPQVTLAESEDLALVGSPVTFTHTATAGTASGLSPISGNGQTAQAGTRLPADLVVRLLDESGNGVPGAAVTWVVGTGGGSVTPENGTTDPAGYASAQWTLGPTPGQNRLDAVVSGVGVVNFSATGTAAAPAAPTSTTITSDSPDPSTAGAVVTVSFRVDASGVIPSGTVTVTDGVQSCSGTLSGGSGSCQLALSTVGQRTLRATYSGAAGLSGSSATADHRVDPAPSGNTPPDADFNSQCEGLTCTFTDASTDRDGAVVGWNWNFGDGATTTQREPTHTFPGPGRYTVTLTATDDDGATDQSTETVEVEGPPPPNQAPTAAFTFDCDRLSCSFNSDDSGDSDGRITGYSWEFGDGGTSSDRKPRHDYAAAGQYNVTLRVTDDDGATGSVTHQVMASPPDNREPQAEFDVSCTNLTCTFTDRSTDDDGTIVSRVWNYGDGSPASSTPSHTYSAPGEYTVVLTVTDDRGGTDTRDREARPTAPPQPNQPPTAAFTSTCSQLSCSFNSDASGDGDGQIDSYAWDFGDGGESNDRNPQHDYAVGGTYNVTLTVTDDDGATDIVTQPVTVTAPNQPPSAAFTSTCDGLTCSFDSNGSSDPGGSIVSWDWTFGDGEGSADANPSHTYGAGDTYTVTLTVTDDEGATNSQAQQVTVTDPSTGP